MWQLTIRDTDDALDRRLRQLAQRQGVSLNRTALQLLRKGVGMSEPREPAEVVGSSLDDLIGTWSAADEAEFLQSIEPLEQVDPTLWA